ncbi:MAG: sigma-70 family RNA polymerase sigma factor [Lachnospiraceae bacterium]|nr:sigma-70 family RNA polymerase sigma factor [Lachnospiraceae bacterium]MDE7239692.1 sigma-70 family RNA polymerase sigma factor [Lachnospiraceae bacterium]
MTKIYEELTRYITENQNRYYRLAYSYVKEEQAALDVVQNAVVKALEHVHKLRKKEYMGTWLYRIVMNESVNYLRRNARETPCEEQALGGVVQDEAFERDTQYGNPETIVLNKPEELYEAILTLPESMQTVIKLYFFEELTMPEIAAITGVNLSTVKYRLYHGLQKLKLTMKEGVA